MDYKHLTKHQQWKVFTANQNLVFKIARRYTCHEHSRDDLIQCGFEGLWKAIRELDKFKPEKGALSTFLGWYIMREMAAFTYADANNSGLSAGAGSMKGCIKAGEYDDPTKLEYIRLRSNYVGFDYKIDENDDLTIAETFGEDDQHYDGLDVCVRKLLFELDEFHRDVIVNHYGIDCVPQSLQALGRKYAITSERAGQHVKAALEQLRELPGTSNLAVYL